MTAKGFVGRRMNAVVFLVPLSVLPGFFHKRHRIYDRVVRSERDTMSDGR
jgi:hypothetical protein